MGYYIKARRPRRGAEPAFSMHLFLWGPLWEFACREAPDILDEEDVAFGFTSDGHYVNAAKARALAARLTTLLRKGVVGAESRAHAKRARRERLGVCPACRGRRIVLYRAVPHDFRGSCARCDGTGHPRSFPRFRTAWVREFRDFCAGSGGFWIR
jgi:hypothetical protein